MRCYRINKKFLIVGIAFVITITFGIAISCQDYYFFNLPQKPVTEFNDFKSIETITKSDILFVIDNSGSMAQEQENLAENLREFINGIVSAQNDFHIGVITTDVDYLPLDECTVACTNGMDCIEAKEVTKILRPGSKYCTKVCNSDSDCPPYDTSRNSITPSVCVEIEGFEKGRKYCIPENNGRLRSCKPSQQSCQHYNGEHPKVLTSKIKSAVGDDNFIGIFRDNVKVGINGTGFEKGLSAIRMALDRDWRDPLTGKSLIETENAGFLRPDAKLTIIVLTDEEDCSYIPYDPTFNEDNNDRCYPNPNTCHPDCQPMQPENGSCAFGATPTVAMEDSDYAIKGESYCMKECSDANTDCATYRWAHPQCGKVPGFDQSRNYCFCDFNEGISNPISRYDSLIPTREFSDFLKNLKGNAGVNMAVITGARIVGENDRPSDVDECASVNGVACGAKRYFEVAKGLDKYYLDSICKADYGQTMIDIVNILIASNEVTLGGRPSDPSCLTVKINNEDVERCEIGTQICGRDAGGVDAGGSSGEMTLEGCLTSSSLSEFKYCEGGARCLDKDNVDCVDRGSLENTLKKVCNSYFACHCQGQKDSGGNPVPCKRPIYWQYVPSECDPINGLDKVKFYGCGLGPGDKIEINALIGESDGSENITCSVSQVSQDAGISTDSGK